MNDNSGEYDDAKYRQITMNKLNEVPELFTNNFQEDNFYSNQEKYLLDEVENELYKQHLPKERINLDKFIEYPAVLWKAFCTR